MILDELYLLSQSYIETKNQPYQRHWLQKSAFEHRLSILVGQRGVGKTTLIIQYLMDFAKGNIHSKEILYVPSDHFLLSNYALYEIAETFYQQGGKLIAFDEIHKYAQWSKELKSIYDTFPFLKIIASGSSALEIHKGSHDLSRRAIVRVIHGLSFREFIELHHHIKLPSFKLEEILENHEKICDDINTILQSADKKILAEFKYYLRFGYYPYFIELKSEELYFITLEQNLHTTIESDLPAIYPALTGNSIRKMKQLLAYIASSVPFTPNFSKLKNLVEIGDDRTIKTYFKYLEDAGLIRQMITASEKLSRIESVAKIYLNNTNQVYAISAQKGDIGSVRELFFLSMLSVDHELVLPSNGDFLVDKKFVFEIGGKKKMFQQIQNEKNGYIACDEIEKGIGKKIPLWLFGFLY